MKLPKVFRMLKKKLSQIDLDDIEEDTQVEQEDNSNALLTESDDENDDNLEFEYLEQDPNCQEDWFKMMFKQAASLAMKRKVDYIV